MKTSGFIEAKMIYALPQAEGWNRVLNGNRLDVDESTYIDRLAERWRIIARVCLENEGNLELIRYEDFVDGKVEV